jgi:hypothetical protein
MSAESPTSQPGARPEAPTRADSAQKWWQSPTLVTLLVAIVASVSPLTAGVQGFFQARHQQQLERTKQLNELRQRYLDRVLSDKVNKRVLEFLVAVEEDAGLQRWATAELKKTTDAIEQSEARQRSKRDLYLETIRVVSTLAAGREPVTEQDASYVRFWGLYNQDLLPVESAEVESVMVLIGRELRQLAAQAGRPGERLRELSFTLARTMKEELRREPE